MLFGGGAQSERRAVHASASGSEVLRVVWRPGSCPFEVVGESHYQPALARLCGGHSRAGHDLECRAQLMPEPTNAYDANALKVMIGGALVGYVPREQAVRLKAEAERVGRGGAIIEAAAIVRGGWRTNQYDEGDFGIRLGIPTWGPVSFEGFADPRAQSKVPKSPRKPAPPVELAPEDLTALEVVIERLETSALLSDDVAERCRRAFYSAMTSRMLSDGVTSGVASGAPDHLNQGEEHFRAEMGRMDNLLREQVRIFQQGLDQWFKHGERFPPYYPHRIAVILRKAKRGDLEQRFLKAYVRHFGTWRTGGARYAEIVERAAKLGISSGWGPAD